jgi:hypothetical protein
LSSCPKFYQRPDLALSSPLLAFPARWLSDNYR